MDLNNRQRFFDKLATILSMVKNSTNFADIKKQEDWYRVTLRNIYDHGGAPVLFYYGGSLTKGLL